MKRVSTKILTIVMTVILSVTSLTGCVKKNQETPQGEVQVTEQGGTPEAPSNLNDDMSFVLTKDGIKKDFTNTEGVPKVHYYFDLLCSDCQRVHEQTHDILLGMVKEGKMELKYHPTFYIDTAKKPETEDFRNARRGALTYDILFSANFFPADLDMLDMIMHESYTSVQKEDVEEAKTEEETYITASMMGETFEKYYFDKKDEMLAKVPVRDTLVNSEELQKISHKGKMFVPFIYVEGEQSLDGENENVGSAVLEPLHNIVDSIEPCGVETNC